MAKYRISDIENFVSAVGCRTLVEAARKLGISQPALSESVKRLESDLDFVLFYRSRTGIQLTPSGKTFLVKANRFLGALSDLDESKNERSSFSVKTILMGCHSTVTQYVIPNALTYIAERAPDYKIKLHHDLSRNIQMEVQRGNIDVAIVINPAEVPDLVIKRLGVDVVSVWSGKDSSSSDTVVCNPSLFQTQHILRKWKNKPSRIIETDSLELIARLAHSNLGLGILPRRAVGLMGFNLFEVDSLPTYRDQICLVHRPEFGVDRTERLVIEAIKAAL